jgi:hypothetical protein
LFGELRRAPESCRVIIEGKRLGDGLGFARPQVNRYAETVGHPVDVAVTDGPRLRLFRHDHPDSPPLYANFSVPRATAAELLEALRYPAAS